MAKSNLTVRVLTALVGVPSILGLLYFGPAWAFYILVAAATAVGAAELFAMTHEGDRVSQAIGTLSALVVSCCVYFFPRNSDVLFTLIVVIPLVGMFVPLIRLGDMRTVALRVTAGAFAPLYIGGSFTCLALLRKEQPGWDGPGFVVLALAFAWLSDTGGYFAGRAFGKRKLYEAVSPKKTVEGALGGLAASLAGAIVAHLWLLSNLPLTNALILGVVATVLGQAGDLGESLLKRSTGVKDSGAILPGHGGILDRIDALILTSTVVYLYARWFA